ncbi:hypothetical protein CJ030_MR4G025771 [Morella rubra]|uniref:Protein GRIM REAPER n=1 Tax=Morella rubra TaxID=262757 RepID=A0A6A1W1C8_9ROSI|nr:hypothetical protein CJ030_MR4G025771 [Morella rubra]
MAATLLKVTTILSLILPALLLTLNSQVAFSEDIEDDEDIEYVLDSPVPDLRSRSRFLTSVIQEGAFCHPDKHRICNGVSANKGTCFFQCCKKHCRNVLKDQNNCGQCGKKCKQGERCCNEPVPMSSTMLIIVASVQKNVSTVSSVTTDIVGMLEYICQGVFEIKRSTQ